MNDIENLIKNNKELIEARKQMLKMLHAMEIDNNELIRDEEMKLKKAVEDLNRIKKEE